ncbi:MAG: DUF3365 domain-containing protein [Thermodesulfovibrionales bacterium]|nr:DUF3365 domain-containing protein [Thermodesulfovibrionales bacterium]
MSIIFKIILLCALTLTFALGTAFYFVSTLQERLIMGQIENEARAIFKQIVITRQWIADHGGIFIENKSLMKPNPYLDESEIIDIQGRKYIRSSPAMVTKEISKYAKDMELYWFHITSLKLVNPENKPDGFEYKALVSFEKKTASEFITIEHLENKPYLRYMAPLFVEKSCLRCHYKQNYQIGDVRGAISVMIPIQKTLEDIESNKRFMKVSSVLTVIVLMSALFIIIQKVVMSPMRRLKKSIADFSEGKYSPDNMIKTGDEFEDLCRTFSEMAYKISENQKELEQKIKEAVNELEETNKMLKEINSKKSDFIARASHELRTPLTTIKGSMDYISSRLSIMKSGDFNEKSVEELNNFLTLVKKNCERLIKMVNNMLDIERIEQGVFESNLKESNLSKLIEEIAVYMKPEADLKEIEFIISKPDNLPVFVDEDMIRQLLINLLSNAIKFSPHGGKIIIESKIDDKMIITSIIDDGKGIDEEEKKKVFDKFYKSGDNKTGSGLGLSISKGIVEFHNGFISVKDRQDGKSGACFTFTLPVSLLPERF